MSARTNFAYWCIVSSIFFSCNKSEKLSRVETCKLAGGCDKDGDGYCDEKFQDIITPKDCLLTFSPCGAGTSTCPRERLLLDCDDSDPDVHPGARHLCNGKDNACDGRIDQDVTHESDPRIGVPCGQQSVPADKIGIGVCHLGETTCELMGRVVCKECDGPTDPSRTCYWGPHAEVCNGLDDDCNGLVDDGTANQVCGTHLIGECHPGLYLCRRTASGEFRPDTSRCVGEQLPTNEIICDGRDHHCNGRPNDGCSQMVACPSNTTAFVGMEKIISIRTASVANPRIEWKILSSPPNAERVIWSPDPPTSAIEQFLATTPGEYVIQIIVIGDGGFRQECRVSVRVIANGLRAELVWNGEGDLDLHMHNDRAQHPWSRNSVGNDCYYGNCIGSNSTVWSGSFDENPHLDLDNRSGFGPGLTSQPENISIKAPLLGRPYTIAVHQFSSGAGRVATVRIYCREGIAATYISAPMAGREDGDCSLNTFWKVASVVFTADGCIVTPINVVLSHGSQCNTF